MLGEVKRRTSSSEDQRCAGEAGWARLLWPHGEVWGSQSSAPSVLGLCLADPCVCMCTECPWGVWHLLPSPSLFRSCQEHLCSGHGVGPLGMAGSGGDPGAAPGAVGLCVPWPGQGQGHHFLHKTLCFRSFSANGLLQEQDLHAGPDPLNGESSVHQALSSRGFHAFPFPSLLVSSFLLRQKDVESSLLSFARQLAATPRLSLARAEQLMGPWGCSRAAKLFPAPAGPRQRAAATSRPIPPECHSLLNALVAENKNNLLRGFLNRGIKYGSGL